MDRKTHVRVRLDTTRLNALRAAAKRNGRTLTSEITYRLDQSLTSDLLNAVADRIIAELKR